MNFSSRITLLTMLLIMSSWEMNAQDTTLIAPVPVTTKPDSTPVAPAPVAAPEPTKTKKDGFNSHTRFGFRGGGIISSQKYESNTLTEDPESKFGLDLALLVAIPLGGGFFMIQPELHFLQKGYHIEDAAPLYGDVTTTLNYMELPILARVNFGGSVKVFAFAGPSVGYLLSGTYEDDNGSLDPKDYLDDVEYSAHIGAGVGIGTFEVDIRYIAGLSDISDSDNLSDVRNSSYGVGLTLKF